MRPILSVLVLAIASLPSLAQDSLETGFKNPPDSAKPHTWWHWINGNVSKAGITADLEAMKEIGLGGAQIFNVEVGIPEGDTPFMSPQWQECLAHALKEAKRLGIEICLHNCAGWSSSGGPWVKPEHAMQNLTWSETEVTGPTRFDAVLKRPESKLDYYRDVAVFAYPLPAENAFRVPNIRTRASFDRGDRQAPDWSAYPDGVAIARDGVRTLTIASDGRLEWAVPDGKWVIVRLGHTPTGAVNAPSPLAGRGPEVDKMSRVAMDAFWEGAMAPALLANGAVGKVGLNNALIDSYEVGSQNWTPNFVAEFKKRRGYDPTPLLLTVTGRVLSDSETTERFLWDYRRTVCDLFADNYFGYFKELCHKNGLLFSTEGYGNGSFDNLQVSGMADVPMGEFWVGGMAIESTKLASSAAHTNGRTFVGAEAFTTDDVRGRWLVDPYSVKALGDRVFSLGVNRYIFHRYTHQPWTGLEPGMTMGPWGMNLERTITWWQQGKAWMDYIARCQFLLQSGQPVADVLVFTGEDGPNDLAFLKGQGFPEGFDYDGCDATVLMRAKVENGAIVLASGTRYRVLVLPDSKWMTPKMARKVASLVSEGGTVLGPRPERSPSLADLGNGDEEVRRIGELVWGDLDGKSRTVATFGRGRVYWGPTLAEVLAMSGLESDLATPRPVNWLHRTVNGAEVYFVANPAYRPVELDATFRVTGLQPQLWDPETGRVSMAPIFTPGENGTRVRLRLEAAGSVFVVFKGAIQEPVLRSVTYRGTTEERTKPPVIDIVSARYEALDGSGGSDVTDKVRQLFARGETEIGATNANFGDPTVNHLKHLKVSYTIDGVPKTATIPENGVLVLVPMGPDDALPDYRIGDGFVELWRLGDYEVQTRSGTFVAQGQPRTRELTGAWNLRPQAGRGAPSEVVLPKLVSWTESSRPGLKYFSGTGTYTKSFQFGGADGQRGGVWLDLGRVKNFAEVELNGHQFPILWKAPFRLEIGPWLKTGNNTLRVKVTNLWPNRLIGDELLPDDAEWTSGPIRSWPEWITKGHDRPQSDRVTFTTWKFYNKDSPLLESGLLGPVRLLEVTRIPLQASP